MNISRPLSLIVALFLVACDKPLPVLEGIDADKWAKDKNGCGRTRVDMYQAIDREKEKLLGLNQMEIVQLLGRPDENELSSRNQKFFYYYIEPAAACGQAVDSTARRLVIRFNAVGLAKESLIE